jgi:hypothetical protein
VSISLEVEGYEYKPGDTIRGRVRVLEGKKSRGLEVVISMREETADYKSVGFSASTGKISEGDLQPGAVHEFSIQLPPDAYPSIDVGVGRLTWRVVAKSDELGPDTTHEQPILVMTPGSAAPAPGSR